MRNNTAEKGTSERGKMTREEFNSYMNKKFDEMIDRLCPTRKDDKEEQ